MRSKFIEPKAQPSRRPCWLAAGGLQSKLGPDGGGGVDTPGRIRGGGLATGGSGESGAQQLPHFLAYGHQRHMHDSMVSLELCLIAWLGLVEHGVCKQQQRTWWGRRALQKRGAGKKGKRRI